jgi:hypothetical protein
MIIVTGPGRSGTTFVANLYRELGFDPGGEWVDETNSGLEAQDVFAINVLLLRDLGVSALTDRVTGEDLRRKLRDPRDPHRTNRFVAAGRNAVESAALKLLGNSTDLLTLIQWSKYDELAALYKPLMIGAARGRDVVKDPKFCWTLRAWVGAGVPVEHVLICIRNLDSVVKSHAAAGHTLFRSRDAALNAFTYAIGLCVTAVHDLRIPYSIVQFPDFLEDPERLYDAMRFPRPVTREQFDAAFERVRRADLVHDAR